MGLECLLDCLYIVGPEPVDNRAQVILGIVVGTVGSGLNRSIYCRVEARFWACTGCDYFWIYHLPTTLRPNWLGLRFRKFS